jgi:hypothetical protein
LKVRDHLGDVGIDGRLSVWIKKKWHEVWTGFFWLCIGFGGGLIHMVMEVWVS